MKDIPDYLEIYLHWINLYTNAAKERNLTEPQIQKLLKAYRAPTSFDDYIMICYAHDSVECSLDRDMKYL